MENDQMLATENQKNAVFDVAGGAMMLILTLLVTIQTALTLFSNMPSSILSAVLPLLVTVGMWMLWSNAKAKKQSTTGISLIRIPFIIEFVLLAICMVFALIVLAVALSVETSGDAKSALVVSFVCAIIVFLYEIFYFYSINNCLKDGLAIMKNQNPSGKAPGKFAAVAMAIEAIITAVPLIVFGIMVIADSAVLDTLVGAITEALNEMNMASAAETLQKNAEAFGIASGVVTMLSGLVMLAYQGLAALLMFRYIGKRNA